VSASSSEDLFDEHDENMATRHVNVAADVQTQTADVVCDDRRRGPPSTGNCDADSLAGQPVTASHRPLSASQPPVTDHASTSRHDVPRSSAHVTTFQITPTLGLRQRAFPRTNPAYVGTYRRDRPPAYRRIDSTTTSLGMASELLPTSPATTNNGTRRPNSEGTALIQHTADVVYPSTAGPRRLTSSSGHQRLNDRTSSCTSSGVAAARPQSEGGSSLLHVSDCRAATHNERYVDVVMTAGGGSVIRRQSEPDYVNVINRHHHHHQLQQQQHGVRPGEGRYDANDSECMTQLVPSAIYMNQHELTIAGRYTSRSTCNFMDPTANGKYSQLADYDIIHPSIHPFYLSSDNTYKHD